MILVNALHVGMDDGFSLHFFSANKYIIFLPMIYLF